MGIFPGNLKVAKVMLVYRKASKPEFSNYRPISMLSSLDKVIENIVHQRLTAPINEQKVLKETQFCFQKKSYCSASNKSY